ncbi:UDP-N-acetylglucosamine 4,6-dehydratase family protein [Bacillus cereus]|nr:nucleoside-diphosphate sugar epimerase/dehydratase [Bacillus cereus]MDA2079887.1 nucleoside-diphosphate sugar epimerase/dehydratase [Bacillus cereus]MDA2085477.1 nucleoside-diphosphate sugar epimerase/dehydratase [Bacillus cereus]MDA2178579.1 nucleoside-diphosphate sugar epimerase/dehydratase [Bacillus cereus]
MNENLLIRSITNFEVEQLLGRKCIQLNVEEVSNYIKGKVILVTGAGGSIGSELCRQISCLLPKTIILLGHGENSIFEINSELKNKGLDIEILPIIADIQDRDRIEQVFLNYKPHVVFHAAAHKHVSLMELNPIEAIKNNVIGSRNVISAAHINKVERFVLISTDKAVNPTSVMGTTKRIAEMLVQYYGFQSETKFASVRFGNVLGSRGSVISIFKKQIEVGGPITVTHPQMQRFFMTIPEAVQLVIQTGSLLESGSLFILDMGEPVKIVDLAKKLIRLYGLELGKEINIIYTGINPGEKLHEEILTKEEKMASTNYDGIYISKFQNENLEYLEYYIEELESLIKGNPQKIKIETIKKYLKEIVPTYNNKFIAERQSGDMNKEVRRNLMELVPSHDKTT